MRKIITPSHFTTLVFAALMPTAGCCNPNATFTVRVVDDEGTPINIVHSEVINVFDDGGDTSGWTDKDGLYSKHLNNIFEVAGYFEKLGYYKTSGVFWEARGWGDVPPADTNFTIVLKRIINPLPLKHRKVNLALPRLDEPVGFDLEIGDWVEPDGKGKIADIVLTGSGFYNSEVEYAFNMTAELPGELNGIQSFYYPAQAPGRPIRSELPPPPLAPESGYLKTFERFTKRVPTDRWHGTTSRDDSRKWIFRVRTKIDEEGKIIAANYGWTTEDIVGASNTGKGRFAISYYYNPDPHSRSLEPKEIADMQKIFLPEGEK
jgi:hypothetical protein